jgi:hypothetical protein
MVVGKFPVAILNGDHHKRSIKIVFSFFLTFNLRPQPHVRSVKRFRMGLI